MRYAFNGGPEERRASDPPINRGREAMKKKTALSAAVSLLAAVCLSACNMGPLDDPISTCDAGAAKKNVKIKYGDSDLSVDVKEQKVKRDEFLAFDLNPDSHKGPDDLDYKTVMVTIEGKDSNSSWIAASGTYNGSGADHLLLVCVPSDQADGTYEYFVTVSEVGTLDPRVVVEP
jgi:hypothetical protein